MNVILVRWPQITDGSGTPNAIMVPYYSKPRKVPRNHRFLCYISHCHHTQLQDIKAAPSIIKASYPQVPDKSIIRSSTLVASNTFSNSYHFSKSICIIIVITSPTEAAHEKKLRLAVPSCHGDILLNKRN